MDTQILAPAAALVLWSLIMLLWMVAARFPALIAAGTLKDSKPGSRGQNLEGVLPDKVNWKAHNYSHLMEQPTLFYPVVIILALAGHTQMDLYLAWAYVGLRVVHSLWQNLVNTIPVRIIIFTVSSIILLAMAMRALIVCLDTLPQL